MFRSAGRAARKAASGRAWQFDSDAARAFARGKQDAAKAEEPRRSADGGGVLRAAHPVAGRRTGGNPIFHARCRNIRVLAMRYLPARRFDAARFGCADGRVHMTQCTSGTSTSAATSTLGPMWSPRIRAAKI